MIAFRNLGMRHVPGVSSPGLVAPTFEVRQHRPYSRWAMRFTVGDSRNGVVVLARGAMPVHFALLDGDE